MYVDESGTTDNYEHLWSLNDTDGGDPIASSLFNITTLQTLISLGQQAPNIVGEDYNKTYGVDFNLTAEWDDLAVTLNLDANQTYMLWLWM